jgi:hypothetical protein
MDLQGSQGHILNGGEARCRYRDHHNLLKRVLLEGSRGLESGIGIEDIIT